MHGRWVLGFVYEKSASVIMSKFWGVATALQMAWHSGIPKLTVESDSKIAFESLENPFFCI
uniref:RNase H type-1 domain-containing protein n=1 Tax=Glycine max TaxID=3847 RepID=K7LAZ1_SOYBN